jgi:hypothetical protein
MATSNPQHRNNERPPQLAAQKTGNDCSSPGAVHQAALRAFPIDPVLAAWLKQLLSFDLQNLNAD